VLVFVSRGAIVGGYIPLPSPLITRPSMSMGNEYAAACRMPPVAEIKAPIQRVFFLPSQSPNRAVKMQPTRLPSAKLLMKMPSMLGVDS
jgi:hypothetical protein